MRGRMFNKPRQNKPVSNGYKSGGAVKKEKKMVSAALEDEGAMMGGKKKPRADRNFACGGMVKPK